MGGMIEMIVQLIWEPRPCLGKDELSSEIERNRGLLFFPRDKIVARVKDASGALHVGLHIQ